MKPGDKIVTPRLIIRHWNKKEDGDVFFELNNNPAVMRFFAGRRSRAESDALLDIIATMIADHGYGWTAIALRDTGQVIGFGGLAPVAKGFPNGPSAEIGWRLMPQFWGMGYATEAAQSLLEYGFEKLALPEILSFAVRGNDASFAVMKRIGMLRHAQGDFDHPRVSDAYPDLKWHECYRIDRQHWLQQKTAG